MKNISLTDAAYEALASQKMGPQDSFSKVILRSFAQKGSPAYLLRKNAERVAPDPEKCVVMEEAIEAGKTVSDRNLNLGQV